jgi:hypothetical protein
MKHKKRGGDMHKMPTPMKKLKNNQKEEYKKLITGIPEGANAIQSHFRLAPPGTTRRQKRMLFRKRWLLRPDEASHISIRVHFSFSLLAPQKPSNLLSKKKIDIRAPSHPLLPAYNNQAAIPTTAARAAPEACMFFGAAFPVGEVVLPVAVVAATVGMGVTKAVPLDVGYGAPEAVGNAEVGEL